MKIVRKVKKPYYMAQAMFLKEMSVEPCFQNFELKFLEQKFRPHFQIVHFN